MSSEVSRRRILQTALAAPLVSLAGCARRGDASLTPRVEARRFGVVVHLERFPPEQLDGVLAKVKTLGIGSVRGVVFPWSHVEAPRGRWKWEATDAQVEAVERAGLEPMGHLGPSASWASSLDPNRETNPWGWSDYPPDDMNAWREYVRRIVRRYAGRIRIWSPYNEPDNLDLFCPPRTEAEARDSRFLLRRREAFLAMQKITYAEAKQADPTCTVLSGAFSIHGRVDPDFIPWLMARRYGNLMDAFDVHAYDTLGAIRASVTRARRMMALHGLRKPIWMSEVGAAVRRQARGGRPFASEDVAAFVPKALVTILSLGAERAFWYQGYPEGNASATVTEPGFALITAEGPTPAADAYAMTVRLLDGCRYAGPMTACVLAGRAAGHTFESGRRRVLVAWAEAPDGLPNTPARAEAVVWWSGRVRRLSLTEKPTVLPEDGARV